MQKFFENALRYITAEVFVFVVIWSRCYLCFVLIVGLYVWNPCLFMKKAFFYTLASYVFHRKFSDQIHVHHVSLQC